MSNYECPYCGADLVYEDTYGQGVYWKQDNKPTGDIYRCPNHEGFPDEESAYEYWDSSIKGVHSDWEGFEDGWNESRWEEVSCESNTHNVSGSFYTDEQGDLQEGYPC